LIPNSLFFNNYQRGGQPPLYAAEWVLLQALLKYPFDDLNEKAIYTGIGRKKCVLVANVNFSLSLINLILFVSI
jgi:hypothetical protein